LVTSARLEEHPRSQSRIDGYARKQNIAQMRTEHCQKVIMFDWFYIGEEVMFLLFVFT
jgi:hypothetical protein